MRRRLKSAKLPKTPMRTSRPTEITGAAGSNEIAVGVGETSGTPSEGKSRGSVMPHAAENATANASTPDAAKAPKA